MADDIVLNAGTGGDTLAADDIAGKKYPRSKLVHGADGVNAGDVSTANPLPTSPRTPNGDSVCDDTNDAVKVVSATAANFNCTEASGTAIAASLAVLDDWDESDRAKVNPIVGQAGVAAGAGAVGATVQRTTLASDDPAVTALQIIDDWDESDRAKVNIIAGQVGVAGGSGTVGATTQRVCVATDTTVAATQSGSWTVAVSGTVTVGSHAVTNAGTFAVQAAQSGTWNVGPAASFPVIGSVNDGTTIDDAPVLMGNCAHSSISGTALGLVDDADISMGVAGLDRVPIFRPHTVLGDIVRGTATITDGSSTSVISAQGASVKTAVVEIIIANSSSSNVTVDLRDGTGGSVLATFPVPANGGVVKTLSLPLIFSANTAVAADPSAAASSIVVTLIGFKTKV